MTSVRFALRMLGKAGYAERGMNVSVPARQCAGATETNGLRSLVDPEGRGIWKWEHYYDIYERHFSRFAGRPVTVVEIGVMGGGSLDLWRRYFGPKAAIYGVDVNPDCRRLLPDHDILIGDQGSRDFWHEFKERIPAIDVVIDDGSHRPEDQIVTLEELLPMLNPGGVFLCEDIHGVHNGFCEYVHGLTKSLNAMGDEPSDAQRWLSVHSYPYVAVIEKHQAPIQKLRAPKMGRFIS